MSEADAKLRQEREVPWRRWQMDELAPSQRTASDRNAGKDRGQPQAPLSKQDTDRKQAHKPAQASPAKQPQKPAQAKPDEAKAGQAKPEQAQADQAKSAQVKQRRAAAQHKAALEAERKKAREAGYQEGYREGLEAGQSEGQTQGHAQGLEQGRKEAQQELQQQLRKTLNPVRNLATHFSQALAQLDDDIANELVELALATGRQLAGAALDAHPAQVVELVRGLLHSEPAMYGRPRLWLHPKDQELVSQAIGQELKAAGWALQPDDQVSRGGCRVTSANGELDATWESRWESVHQQVRGRSSTSEIAAAAGELKAAAEATAKP